MEEQVEGLKMHGVGPNLKFLDFSKDNVSAFANTSSEYQKLWLLLICEMSWVYKR